MAYKVIEQFKALEHDGHIYSVGDIYPVQGKKATKARLEQLSTEKNKYKRPFIAKEKTPEQE